MFLMLDFETLGTAASSIVISLGAVAFNQKGVHREWYFTFDIEEQRRAGRTFDTGTLQWWIKQSGYAKGAFEDDKNRISMVAFLDVFTSQIKECLSEHGETTKQLMPMSNGADFDIVMLDDIYRMWGKEAPWDFWNTWCFRTFAHLTKCKTLVKKDSSTAHNALDDALFQVSCVQAVWQAQAARASRGTQPNGHATT